MTPESQIALLLAAIVYFLALGAYVLWVSKP